MNKQHGWFYLFTGLMVAAWAGQDAHGQGGKPSKPKGKVTAYAAVDGVAAGAPFDVGLQWETEKGWHIYWQNPGEAGIAPRAEWTLPTGFTVGSPRFPRPYRHVDPAGAITTNILEGSPVLVYAVTPPATLSDKEVSLTAKLKYLICREVCLQETAEVAITLPVKASPGDVKPAHGKIFEGARKEMPATESKHFTIKPAVTTTAFTQGAKFDLVVDVEVAKGSFLHSRTPTAKDATKFDFYVERTPHIYFNEPVYPEPVERETAKFGKLSLYDGKVTLRVSGEVEDTPEAFPLRFGGVIVAQACHEDGTCSPEEAVQFHFVSGVAEGIAAPVTPAQAAGGTGSGTPVAAPATSGDKGDGVPTTMAGLLLFAFLGGLILNVMPCVLPVISIKILSFVQQSREEPGRVFRLGLTFCAGIMASFWALAIIIILIKSAGGQLGWGFQFQQPGFVIIMMAVMFIFGLSLLGVFEITLPGAAMGSLSAAESHEGYSGAFMKGVLGTILATPCTAPFLGPALGVAFASTNAQLFTVFTFVGLGMASPFFLLTWKPAWLRYLPRPGTWMVHFKQLMGFMLMGTVVWMLYVLGKQIGPDGVTWSVGFLGFLAIACWILGLQTPLTPTGRRVLAWAVALGISLTGWWVAYARESGIGEMQRAYLESIACACDLEAPPLEVKDWAKKIPWQKWHKGRAENLAKQGYTVYVDYTAVWCATCLANKAATLETDEVRNLMRDHCVVPLKADFTSEDPEILGDLQRFQRSGVPLNVIFPAGNPDGAIVMPEQLVGRVGLVVEKLKEAGPSTTCMMSAVR